ncbi:MAG: ATP-dependent helicase [Beijerinckiaceae bacterium]|nr:ATP-dependent helicase [Beijerinckiaceae bacterium]
MNAPTKLWLSPEQQAVVSHVDGALLVIAGPGSGKTRVLTERIRNLLTTEPGHFRILALTFTNKAADEMRERLADLGEDRQRAYLGTLHSFCLDMLAERGKLVGVDGMPNIFEQIKDRKEILLKAVQGDPALSAELDQARDSKDLARIVDQWLAIISHIKGHPVKYAVIEDEMEQRLLDAYDAEMRACNAYDFDDLLLLVYRLLTENPKLADFYRRLYRFISVDEAQDLNEAQYGVLCALCGPDYKNLVLVGDDKQSIYGFNKSSPEYMERFRNEFHASSIELTQNYRSSRAVVEMAKAMDSKYQVAGQLAIAGEVALMIGADEEDEAKQVVDKMQALFASGHPDVEGPIGPSTCAILGRNRFVLLGIERELKARQIPFYKRLSANHENESEAVEDFVLALRVLANPRDRLHFAALAKRWKVATPTSVTNAIDELTWMAENAGSHAKAVVEAVKLIDKNPARVDMMAALDLLKRYANTLDEAGLLAIHEDVAVFTLEWDQYLKSDGHKNVGSFLSSKALGATQKSSREGVALLTVHSSKGLEFDVVFVPGMSEGTFPDYRAENRPKEMLEEGRNAFVAVTRSKRLLYFSYPRQKRMPWGDLRAQSPSRYLRQAGLA